MYRVIAKKDGVLQEVTKLDVNDKGEIIAVWYKKGGLFPWDFTKDLDFKIEEVNP